MSVDISTAPLPLPTSAGVEELTPTPATETLDQTTGAGKSAPTAKAKTGRGKRKGGEDGEGAASTLSSPIRLMSTTVVELSSTSSTDASTAPDKASVESAATQMTGLGGANAASAVPSTFATFPSASSTDTPVRPSVGTLAAGLAPADNTALPDASSASKHAMPDGMIVAAVTMPILAAIAILAALLFCRRRRRRLGPSPQPFLPAVLEKMNPLRPRASPRPTISRPRSPAAPVVTTAANHVYYPGLNTCSHSPGRPASHEHPAPRGDAGDRDRDPPPPYAKSPPQLPAFDIADTDFASGWPPSYPAPPAQVLSPFDDPVSPLPRSEGDAVMGTSLGVERPTTARTSRTALSRALSFSSTLYSDTASVHEAREARVSTGMHQMLMGFPSPPKTLRRASRAPGARVSGGQAELRRSVFDDPPSPVESIESAEFVSAKGSPVKWPERGSAAGSPVKRAERGSPVKRTERGGPVKGAGKGSMG